MCQQTICSSLGGRKEETNKLCYKSLTDSSSSIGEIYNMLLFVLNVTIIYAYHFYENVSHEFKTYQMINFDEILY